MERKNHGTTGNQPKEDWRNWKSHVAGMDKMTGGKLFDDSQIGQSVYIVSICEYVWDSATGDDLFKHRCVEQALKEAGFSLDRSDDVRRIFIRRIGVVVRSDTPTQLGGMAIGPKHELIRMQDNSGCLGGLIMLCVICTMLTLSLAVLFTKMFEDVNDAKSAVAANSAKGCIGTRLQQVVTSYRGQMR